MNALKAFGRLISFKEKADVMREKSWAEP